MLTLISFLSNFCFWIIPTLTKIAGPEYFISFIGQINLRIWQDFAKRQSESRFKDFLGHNIFNKYGLVFSMKVEKLRLRHYLKNDSS